MEIYTNISFISIFSHFFLVFKTDFIKCVNFTRFVLQIQLMMTSQIRSHIEHLMQTYYILVLIL